jgi:hypothetical protein
MEKYQKQLNNPWVIGGIGFIIGAIIGLVVLGWWLFPVQWTNAEPSDLIESSQIDWINMAIAEFALTGNQSLAVERYNALGEDKAVILVQTGNNLDFATAEQYASYVMAVEPTNATSIILGTPVASGDTAPAAGGTALSSLLPILCGILVAVIAAAAIFLVLRRLGIRQDKKKAAVDEELAVEEPKSVPVVSQTSYSESPLVQQLSSYKLGDDLYDDSFSIDTPDGEFLGEFGVGISETIGVGDPKKVTAFEVWLFDKNDIQTVTKVLMSSHAYKDDALRNRLSAKGDPTQVMPGEEVLLETQTLQMVVRIVDMAYGEGPLPEESFFERLVIELAVWSKGK